ncbi:MAG: fluoride efflux transporter CrcB [Rhodopirellula sp.]|nr:fluoride efflux transporter CrcB [Rhodopirellula sp.]
MYKVFLIALGGGGGTLLRYFVGEWMQRWGNESFPWGTLTVNVLGCFAIGILNVALVGPFFVREEYRLALLVGVLGGFTTFSSFGWETLTLLNGDQWGYGIANFTLNNVLGLMAAWAGYRLAEYWLGTIN